MTDVLLVRSVAEATATLDDLRDGVPVALLVADPDVETVWLVPPEPGPGA